MRKVSPSGEGRTNILKTPPPRERASGLQLMSPIQKKREETTNILLSAKMNPFPSRSIKCFASPHETKNVILAMKGEIALIGPIKTGGAKRGKYRNIYGAWSEEAKKYFVTKNLV